MEQPEGFKQPEIKTKELLELVDTIKWEHGYRFEFNGTKFNLVMTDAESIELAEKEGDKNRYGEPAEYFQSTLIDGYDIYLHATISEADRRRIMFHEVLECNLRQQGYSSAEAHVITAKEEEKNFGKREVKIR